MTRRMALTIPVAFVLVLALVATAGASHGRIYVASQDCLGHTSRPVQITIDCFTGQFYAGNLHYSAYGGRVARGAGRLTWMTAGRTAPRASSSLNLRQ